MKVLRKGVIVTLAVIVIAVGLYAAFPSLCRNLAYVVLNKALWQEQTAIRRQRALSLAAGLLDAAEGDLKAPHAELAPGDQCAMIPSMAIAQHHLRRREFARAALWLHRAAAADPIPSSQDAVLVPIWVSVTPEGNVVLDWSAPNWGFRRDSQPANGVIDDQHGWLTLSYQNTPGKRDKVIYRWLGSLAVPYWHTLQVRARVHKGAFLTIETVSPNGRKRHLNYHQGSGQWETFSIPFDDDMLRFIYISLREPSAKPTVPDHAVDLEPLVLLLDENAGGCEP